MEVGPDPVVSHTLRDSPDSHPPRITHQVNRDDRRFNLLFFGLPECQPGTPYVERITSDYSAISSVFSLDNQPQPSIRDCRRLGKFQSNGSKPRRRGRGQ